MECTLGEPSGVGGAHLGAHLGFVGWADNGVGGAEEADDGEGGRESDGGGEMGSQRGPIRPCIIRSPSPWSLHPPPRCPILSPTPDSFLTSRPLQACRRSCGSCSPSWRCRGGCGAGRHRGQILRGPCTATPAPGPCCATTATCLRSGPSRTRATPSWPSWPSASGHASGTVTPQPAASRRWGCGGVHSGAYWWRLWRTEGVRSGG